MSQYGLKNGYGVLGSKRYAGNQINPYAINDLEDLQSISADNWDANTHYEQTADITLTNDITYNGFTGIYNGNGYAINGANLYNPLFKGAETPSDTRLIKNVKFNMCKVNASNAYMLVGINVLDCVFDTCTIITKDINSQATIWHSWNNNTISNYYTIKNCIALSCNLTSGSQKDSRWKDGVFSTQLTSLPGFNNQHVTNCVTIGAVLTRTSYKIGGQSVFSNNYATNGGTSASGNDGLNITAEQYNSKEWWENMALYDFSKTGAWIWDSVNKLPKLKHTLRCAKISIKDGTWK